MVTWQTVLSSVLAAMAAALAGVGLLHLMPFLAHLDLLGQHQLTPAEWDGFVVGAFVFGGLCGLTTLIPATVGRLALVGPLWIAAGFYMFISVCEQTASSMTSGDSIIVLILMSPIYFAIGGAYLLLVAALLTGLVLGSSLLVKGLRRVPPIAQGVGLAGGLVAALFVVGPSLRTVAGAPAPRRNSKPAPPSEAVVPPCEDPPWSTEMGRSVLMSTRQMRPLDSVVLFYVTVNQSDWTPQNILDSADSALAGHKQCRIGSTVWTPRFQLAQPRPVTLRLRVTRDREMERSDQQSMLSSSLISRLKSSLHADPDAPEYFVANLGEHTFTFDVELLGCTPADDVICIGNRLSVRVPGQYPTLADLEIEWVGNAPVKRSRR